MIRVQEKLFVLQFRPQRFESPHDGFELGEAGWVVLFYLREPAANICHRALNVIGPVL